MQLANTAYGKFYYFDEDDIGRRLAAGEFFDSHLRQYIDTLGEESVLVDVGANIGFFSIYCAKLLGAYVHAFEASQEVFTLLEANVFINGLQERIKLCNAPLYDKQIGLMLNPEWLDYKKFPDGRIDYEHSPNSGGLSLVAATGIPEFISVTLDSFELEKVSILKVDTQGADLRVLIGSRRTIDRCRPIICFEFEHNGCGKNASGDSLQDFQNFIDEIGYSMKCVGGNGHTWMDYVAVSK